MTTLSGATELATNGPQAAFRRQLDALHRRHLQLLRRHRVTLAIGSDGYDTDAASEAMYLHSLGVFEPAELLRMWTETTAKTIFPKRQIGVLEEGAEASFLVLRANPLEDFSAVQRIVRRVKRAIPVPAASL